MEIAEVAEEANAGFAKCETIEKLVDLGVEVFSLEYVDSLKKACWGSFQSHLRRIGVGEAATVAAFDFPAIFHAAFAKHGADEAVTESYARVMGLVDHLKLTGPVVLTMDSASNWRKKAFEGYKISRPEKPPGFRESRTEALEYARGRGANIAIVDDYESDDVMASIAFRCKLMKLHCVLITEDCDLLQCVGNGVTCYSPRCSEYRGEDWMVAKYGISQRQLNDWLCITGKDDVPKIEGLGQGYATEYLKKFGSVMSLWESREALTKKKSAAVDEYVRSGMYFLAKDLHTLSRRLSVRW